MTVVDDAGIVSLDFDTAFAAVRCTVDGSKWGAGSYTNLFTNPSFETSSGTIEVRRNYATSPRGNNGTSWTALGGAIAISQPFDPVDTHCPNVGAAVTTSAAAGEKGVASSLAGANLVAEGLTYTISIYWNASIESSVGYRFAWLDASNAVIGTVQYGGNQSGTKGRISITRTAPTGAVRVSMGVQMGGTVPGGTVIKATGLLIDAHASLRDYCDGTYSPDPDLTPSWASTANASESLLTGIFLAGVPTAAIDQGRNYRTANGPVAGGYAQRFLVTGKSTDAIGIPVGNAAPAAGTTCTLVFWARANGKNQTVIPRIRQQSNEVGAGVVLPADTWVLVRLITVVGTGSPAQIGLLLWANSGHATGDTIDIDTATIAEGSHPNLMPFTGSTKPASIPGSTVIWNGTANASTSTLTIPTINRITITRTTNNTTTRIRGGDTPTINGFLVISDNETPLNTTPTYTITGYNNTTPIRTITLTIPTTGAQPGIWLKIAGNPNATSHANLKTLTDITSTTQGGLYHIAGGAGIGVGVYGGRDATTFTITLQTLTTTTDAALTKTLTTSRILLIQPAATIEPFPPGWYFITQTRRTLITTADGTEGALWTLDVAAATRPSGDTAGVAGVTYALLKARYPTYNDITTSGLTYFELAQGL